MNVLTTKSCNCKVVKLFIKQFADYLKDVTWTLLPRLQGKCVSPQLSFQCNSCIFERQFWTHFNLYLQNSVVYK